jgi:hypothetical protein
MGPSVGMNDPDDFSFRVARSESNLFSSARSGFKRLTSKVLGDFKNLIIIAGIDHDDLVHFRHIPDPSQAGEQVLLFVSCWNKN